MGDGLVKGWRRVRYNTAADLTGSGPGHLGALVPWLRSGSIGKTTNWLEGSVMFKRIDHVEIVSQDFTRSMDFYTRVLGFTVMERLRIDQSPLEEIAYLELGGTVVELMSVTDPRPAPSDPWQAGYRMIALEVEDMDRAVEYLKGKGVEISKSPSSTGKSKRAEIKDPDGLSIELRQW